MYIKKPIIDVEATASAIKSIRKMRGYSVKDVQLFLNFEYPQAIYAWEKGEYLPSIDNLVVLASIFRVPIDELVITKEIEFQCTVKNSA